MSAYFTIRLMTWHANNPRPLPWDGGPRDPYHIWISEIIMQQTRIEQGTPYYKKFISRFPSLEALASASHDEVLRYWQGLGYYTRAVNLHKAAIDINNRLGGVLPQTYEDLLLLPGVGPYSAAAIASFAYGLPYPVVDGNVKRVIARYCGITTPLNDTSLHEQIRSVASSWMKGVSPGDFNQAIMNFGALVCKPKSALCHLCPLSKKCFAFAQHAVYDLPVRSKKKNNTLRYFHFVVIHYRGKFLLHRRDAKDIWRGLYVPPLLERNSSRSPSKIQIHAFAEKITGQDHQQFMESTASFQQLLSHQTLHGRFHHIKLLSPPKKLDSPYTWVTHKTVHEYGKPKMIVEMLERL